MSDILTLYGRAPKPSELMKAMKEDSSKDIVIPKSAIIDPTNVLNYTGTRPKPTILPMATLRNMATVPAISAILKTRLNQVARFAQRPRYDGDMGFKISTKAMETRLSPADKKEAQRIEDFLLTTGAVRNLKRKDNFNAFLRKVVYDSLVLDAMVWEHVPTLKGGLGEIWALDASTIELVSNEPVSDMYELPVFIPYTARGKGIAGEIAYVQRIMGQIVAEYSEHEICYAVRNPQTNINIAPFGRSELEDLIEIVTGIMNGVRYNTSYFTHSTLPQGVLSIVGRYNDEDLEGFKRHWQVMTAGAAGKWKVPVMALEEGQGFNWTAFKNSNRDMEFNQFLEFLFNIACAVYQIDPNEVGFKSWTSKQGGMTQSDNTEAKIEQSQDKGFIPLMKFVETSISSEIIDQINPEFCFTWSGLDDEAEAKRWARTKEQIESGYTTVNMARKHRDEEPINEAWADAPANAQLIQVYMAEAQQKQQQAQMEAQGQQQQQLQEQQHKQNLQAMDKQHEQGKEMAQLQHGQNKEMQQMQNQQQTKEGDMNRFHAGKMADKQHEQAKEMADLQHKQQKELQKDEQGHSMKLEGKKAEIQDQQGEKDYERSKELAEQGHKHQKELAKMTGEQQKELQKDKGNHELTKQAKEHSYAKDMGERDYEKSRDLQKQKDQAALVHKKVDHDFQRKSGDTSHKRGLETSKLTHKQQLELLKEKTKGAKPKGKLQKSFADTYLLDNELIERMAKKVHEAWSLWAGTSDDPDMKPYDELHEAVKETDRACARAVIKQLLEEGIIPSEEILSKAIETATVQDTPEGTEIVISPWDMY